MSIQTRRALLTIIRTVMGGSAIAIAFGAAIALGCLALGIMLRGTLELALAIARGASSLAAFAWTLVR
jgi:hypothetical protein